MTKHDIIIIGGGLAGLTLSMQLKKRLPELDILVIERNQHPVPQATHKVGESCVEIGAHYFNKVLDLRDHLETRQLRKFGFRFFFSNSRLDIDRVLEVGASRSLPTPSYQIDRGIFENFLGGLARQLGVQFLDGAVLRRFALAEGNNDHEVTYEYEEKTHRARSRWLIDAAGRAGLIKRKLDLTQDNGHDVNATWFRIGTRIDVDEWSQDRDWLTRCNPPSRWLSTNHLVGPGYWVWLIPLSSGSHSVGIVADSRIHPSRNIDTFEKVMDWLKQHQPRLLEDIRTKQHLLQDFSFYRRVSYGCKQVFSGNRWALTGEAGVFLDPFYSPGSDFIAISNTYITELVAQERAGTAIEKLAKLYNRFFFSFYQSTLSLYKDQYLIFGNPEVLPVKIMWDYTYYWGVLCQLFFQNRLTDISALGRLNSELTSSKELNFTMQRFLRNWSALGSSSNPPRIFDQAGVDWFVELNRGLSDTLDANGFEKRLHETTRRLKVLSTEIFENAIKKQPTLKESEFKMAFRL